MPTFPLLSAALLALVAAGLPSVALAQDAGAAAPAAQAETDIGHQTPPGFTTDIAAAREAAKKANRPLLVMFCTPHCGPCNALKRSVLPRPEVRANLAEYELAYFNAEASPDIAREHAVRAYPTFVLLTPEGREIGRVCGGSDNPAVFLDRMEELRHRQGRLAGLQAALKKTPDDPALLVARADALLEAADHTMRDAALRQSALADLKAAARLDPEGKTRAGAELAWLDLEARLRRGGRPEDRQAECDAVMAFWRAHPDLRRGDLVLWNAIVRMPKEEAARTWVEFLRRYPGSPQADQGWKALEQALGKPQKT